MALSSDKELFARHGGEGGPAAYVAFQAFAGPQIVADYDDLCLILNYRLYSCRKYFRRDPIDLSGRPGQATVSGQTGSRNPAICRIRMASAAAQDMMEERKASACSSIASAIAHAALIG